MILQGDARHIPLRDKSIQCVVTSPPFWGLRDYGVNGQLGLEETPEEYVANLVAVFREVWRVLRDDGTLWLNLGDSYTSGGRETFGTWQPDSKQATHTAIKDAKRAPQPPGLKPKDLVGIPWRVAFALQADGWVLRSEIIWNKPNPMPESVADRPTKSHEQLFLFSKARWVGPDSFAFSNISDEDARWLALLFDTEGNIVVKRAHMESGRTTYGLQVAIANTNLGLIEAARRIVGTGSVHERPGKNAPVFYWQISNVQAAELMKRVYPFLIIKQRQARLGIYIQSLFEVSRIERLTTEGRLRGRTRSEKHTELLERCWGTMKALNHFGTPDLSWVPEPVFGRWDSQPYYYDTEAVKESCESGPSDVRKMLESLPRVGGKHKLLDDPLSKASANTNIGQKRSVGSPNGRNRRSVWTIATEPYSGAHFATFPRKLVEPCILAGTSARGCCAACGAPWERVIQRDILPPPDRIHNNPFKHDAMTTQGEGRTTLRNLVENRTLDWRPTCTCGASTYPCIVLDPFVGSGTTVAVAESLGRRGIGIELKAEYLTLANNRLRSVMLGLPL